MLNKIFFMLAEGNSPVISCFLYVLLFVLLSEAGLLFFNVWSKKKVEVSKNNEVAGVMFGAISLIYSLILAFVIVAVWTNYDDLNETIQKETDKINSILAHSVALPDSLKVPLGKVIAVYCEQVVDKEWRMQENEVPHHPSAIPALRMRLLKFEPENKSQQNIYSVVEDDLSCISDLRRSRLDHTRSHVPALVWLILKVGSVMMIIFSYFLHASSEQYKRIYLFFLSSIIAMSLFLVYTLDHPFAGSAQVSKKPYQGILLELQENWNCIAK